MLLLIFILNLLVRGPDLWSATHTPQGLWFAGQNSWADHIDLPLYFRVIREGQLFGSFSLINFADSLGTERAIIYPVYTLIGIMGSRSGIDAVLLFHLAGLVTSALLVVVMHWFLGLFIHEKSWRQIGLYWVFLVGGLGWLWFPRVVYPDLGVPIFTLWSALRSPHEALSIMSLLFCLGSGYRFQWRGVALGALGILISHPQMIVPVSITLVCWMLVQRKSVVPLLVALGSASALYYLLIGRTLVTSAMAVGLRTQDTYVFSPLYWLVSLGLIGLLVGFSLWKQRRISFLLLWIVVVLGIFYFPIVPYRGMMIRGVWVAFVAMAIQGASLIAKRFSIHWFVVGSLVLLVTLGNTWLIFQTRMSQTHVARSLFLTQDEGNLIHSLKQHSKEGEGVIASYRLANIIMGQTLLRPYVGHFPLTPHFETRYREVLQFYSGTMSSDHARSWLAATRARWVLMAVEEQQLAQAKTLSYSFLTPEASSGGMILYRVN